MLRAERASVRLDAPVRLDPGESARVLGLLEQAATRLDALADRRESQPYLVGPGYFRRQAAAARAWGADLGELADRQAERCHPPATATSSGKTAISAEQPIPKHPFEQAHQTWDAWSMANTMRLALRHAREHGNDKSLAAFAEHPEWTQGPGPLEALAANRELVERLTGWRWEAVRDARERGHAWAEVGAALGTSPEQARGDFLDRLERQRQAVEHDPSLARLVGYDPRAAQLAEPNAADRAHQHDQQEREAGRER